MTRTLRTAALLVLLPAAGLAAPADGLDAQDADRRLTLDTYMEMEGVADPRVSPDGRRIVYVRQWNDKMTDERKSALWIMNADGSRNRLLVDGGSPRWSPSGDRIAFLACGTPGGDPSAMTECGEESERQVFVRIMEGEGRGSVTQVTRLVHGASDIAWSPDGERIAFTKLVPDEEDFTVSPPGRPDGASWTEPPRVVDRMQFRSDGQGFLPDGHDHVFTVPATGGTPRQITRGAYDHGAPRWSPDGATIYFDAYRDERPWRDWKAHSYVGSPSEIWAADVESREIRAVTDRNGPDRNPAVSPDGEWIAYTGFDSTTNTYLTDRLYVIRPDGSGRRELARELDRSPDRLIWAPGGEGVYFTVEDHGTEQLWFAGLDGEARQVTEGRHTLVTSDISDDGTAVGVRSTPHRPGDVVAFEVGDGGPAEPRWLTSVNEDVLGDVALGEVEEVRWESADGLEIQGWIVKPPDFDPSETYPLILVIHGGPHAMYDVGFRFDLQNHAANGYVSLYANPRGSTGYGSEFGNGIHHDYPGDDHVDLMNGVDEVISRGYVDPDEMLVTGCSGGGVLSSWAVGRTDRFAAAVVRCPVIDWLSFVGTTDGSAWYHNFRELPWDDPSEHIRRSPLSLVGEVSTPTLLMTGVNDLRTPMGQTEEYYRALKFQGVETRMIRMNEEWHGTGRKPSNFMRTRLYVRKWFRQHMGDEMRETMEERRVDGG
ncbi:MAG: S9 family peptidase [Gemmatimonadota bacterium]